MSSDLLLGEWASLGVLVGSPGHGYAVAKRFEKSGDLGRVWTMSRPMVYRCLDELQAQGLVAPTTDGTPDRRGRVELAPTQPGLAAFDGWVQSPVARLRDVRTDLLMRLVLLADLRRDPAPLVTAQRTMAAARRGELEVAWAETGATDPVTAWRLEAAIGLERTLDRLAPVGTPRPGP